jgi:hypothetical protein
MQTKTTTYGHSISNSPKLPGVLYNGNSQPVHFSKEENDLYKILSTIKYKSHWYAGIKQACEGVRVRGDISTFKQLISELTSQANDQPDAMKNILGEEGYSALRKVSRA